MLKKDYLSVCDKEKYTVNKEPLEYRSQSCLTSKINFHYAVGNSF